MGHSAVGVSKKRWNLSPELRVGELVVRRRGEGSSEGEGEERGAVRRGAVRRGVSEDKKHTPGYRENLTLEAEKAGDFAFLCL